MADVEQAKPIRNGDLAYELGRFKNTIERMTSECERFKFQAKFIAEYLRFVQTYPGVLDHFEASGGYLPWRKINLGVSLPTKSHCGRALVEDEIVDATFTEGGHLEGVRLKPRH